MAFPFSGGGDGFDLEWVSISLAGDVNCDPLHQRGGLTDHKRLPDSRLGGLLLVHVAPWFRLKVQSHACGAAARQTLLSGTLNLHHLDGNGLISLSSSFAAYHRMRMCASSDGLMTCGEQICGSRRSWKNITSKR